jgi:hypothetical protein
MKNYLWFLCLLPVASLAADAVPPVATQVVEGFSWKVLIQQILTNGGLALLGFFAAKIPGTFGSVVKAILDWLSANIAHEKKVDNK